MENLFSLRETEPCRETCWQGRRSHPRLPVLRFWQRTPPGRRGSVPQQRKNIPGKRKNRPLYQAGLLVVSCIYSFPFSSLEGEFIGMPLLIFLNRYKKDSIIAAVIINIAMFLRVSSYCFFGTVSRCFYRNGIRFSQTNHLFYPYIYPISARIAKDPPSMAVDIRSAKQFPSPLPPCSSGD
jgi:hypothetical protein